MIHRCIVKDPAAFTEPVELMRVQEGHSCRVIEMRPCDGGLLLIVEELGVPGERAVMMTKPIAHKPGWG